jgi:hypothetical protein
MNDPTQSEQIVVSCSDWVGSFFACSPCVSRVTGFFDFGYHMSLDRRKQFEISEQNVQLGGLEPLLTSSALVRCFTTQCLPLYLK